MDQVNVEKKITKVLTLKRCQYRNVIGKRKGEQCECGCYKKHNYCSKHRYIMKKSAKKPHPRSVKVNDISILV